MNQGSPIRTAFQLIASVTRNGIVTYGYEALARDAQGRVPVDLLKSHASEALYAFDFRCRTQALREAVRLGLVVNLSLNFMPGATCHPRYGIDATVRAALELGFPVERLIVELTEREPVTDYKPLRRCIDRHRDNGARLALDDFGTGFNGLNTLLELRPDIVKVDMKLVQKIETDYDRQALMFGICSGGDRLGMRLVAEGVETLEAVAALSSTNIDLMQGFLFARPFIGGLPEASGELTERATGMLMKLPFSAVAGDMRGALPGSGE
ncbi:EAL domain protein [Paraburkholderia xenovorans LB400]|uniref:Diguanylate phosphodiesterase (EAL domain) n=1 Tax=Paraburkholderia xenovorans (strain LB400) TaxID=266265 RepID=Q13FY6_PARXL|nr:EAL domain-containing protein [Paraburkholderia xenovorans]ABE37003.1 Putative diguanylate phosphodiesterase (EAL domain) [Paraburkholderia xenovorans LB400]AIP34859.1 EAL domain protein [Paraburkholderia xenovorans LB400]